MKGLGGAIYAQTTDVEVEINGILTYDRRVQKINPDEIKPVFDEIFSAFNKKYLK